MRFKHLTATFLRNAAKFIDAADECEEFMCHCIEGWRQDRSIQPGNVDAENRLREFKKILKEMNLSMTGNLLEVDQEETSENGFDGDDWRGRNQQRVMFLLMLADAIAYKPNGGKRNLKADWFPTSVKPPRPGVYERDFGAKNDPTDVIEYNLWDGERWIYGKQDWKGTAEKLNSRDYRHYQSDWRFIQDPVVAAEEEKWYNETFLNALRPMTEFPSKVGVYVLKHEKSDDPHYSYWDGQHWCYTCDGVESAISYGTQYGKSPGVYSYDGDINPRYLGWKNV